MILLLLKKVSQKCIFHVTSSKQFWDHISACYSGGGGGNKQVVSLLKQVFLTTFKDTEPMQPQLNRVTYAA